ncbi:MAG TPA: protein translocase subunit SecF [Candidatus Woesebacteria bacterium]|nr:protein translocase subunit SecF [Candidatus Woesebacteria bacterium]
MVNFLKYSKLYAVISLTVILTGLFSIGFWGFNYSIDFVGGTNLDYQFNPIVKQEQVIQIFESNNLEVEESSIQDSRMFIRTKAIDEKQEKEIRETIETNLKTNVTVLKTETVGPTIGRELLNKTLIAAGIAILGILLYIAYAFKNLNFATAAVVALMHDILIVVGTYSLINHFFGAELDTLFVTALLTTMSFSVHDTIVVFDQIRDYRHRHGAGNIEEYANKALTETMVRSLNNSFTIIFMLSALVLIGGSTIRFFALSLLIGTITGTYSSPFVATPVAVWLEKRQKKS